MPRLSFPCRVVFRPKKTNLSNLYIDQPYNITFVHRMQPENLFFRIFSHAKRGRKEADSLRPLGLPKKGFPENTAQKFPGRLLKEAAESRDKVPRRPPRRTKRLSQRSTGMRWKALARGMAAGFPVPPMQRFKPPENPPFVPMAIWPYPFRQAEAEVGNSLHFRRLRPGRLRGHGIHAGAWGPGPGGNAGNPHGSPRRTLPSGPFRVPGCFWPF